MKTDFYNQIQLVLLNSLNKEKELLVLFKKWGKDNLCNYVSHLDFGVNNNLIKSLIAKVSSMESAKIKKMKFPKDMIEYVKSLNTRRLLSLYDKSRSNQDLMFFCMKNELSFREHIPNKIESKEIRRKKSKKRTSKAELEKEKLKAKIISLKNKEYSLNEICERLNITEAKLNDVLSKTNLIVEYSEELKPIIQKHYVIVGYLDDGKPIYETFEIEIDELVSTTKKGKNVN